MKLDRTEEHIQDLFNRIAPVYDQMNDWLSFGSHRIWKQMAVNWSGARPGHIGLDLCCGTGDLTRLLAIKVGSSGKVVGVDFSRQLLAIAGDRQPPFTLSPAPITWVEADVLDLPFPDHYFDCATMGYGLRNVVDIPRSLKELHRVLKPGGTAAILDFHRPENAFKTFQQWYLDRIVVPVANTFGLEAEYAYLNPSLEKFPTGPQQVALAEAANFSLATHYAIAGGMMGVLVLESGG
ncbi:MAG: bifunctional demethylmenaquinone methyltransferase/2-methoxy-6-polyprenyl-1,4-benzoquinol methylase UbiE [Limnospira maxima]|uniref:2-phytyl-1,4-naphtoquinone methyltransferase n=1 Tax=Limnospira indica PCC 8005 TaxID=376219 RepID=A0A9P1P148_9CYAN|nr:bifunctional demethylmenaquinone methyltransferase/2-methoxy-6-polyprenyl-1,4-benzoquinol methylase UbiE [Limnospira indica]CDM97612.1 Menaquinone biosynthesis methyltransferase UbiE [Limnospira indica PCC 8005]